MTPDDIVRVIVARSPESSAQGLLEHAISLLHARGGAVFALRQGGLECFVQKIEGPPVTPKVREMWEGNMATLVAGGKAAGDGSCLLPLLLNGIPVGAVWMDGVDPRACELGKLAFPLALALEAPTLPKGIENVLYMKGEDFTKQQTMALLHTHGWNIAQVARQMNTTRRTVYLRLARWGIEREKVRKSPKRRRRPMDPTEA